MSTILDRTEVRRALQASSHPFAEDCISALGNMTGEPRGWQQSYSPQLVERLAAQAAISTGLHGFRALVDHIETRRPTAWVELLIPREGDDSAAGRGHQVCLAADLSEVLGIWHVDKKPSRARTHHEARRRYRRTGCTDGHTWKG